MYKFCVKNNVVDTANTEDRLRYNGRNDLNDIDLPFELNKSVERISISVNDTVVKVSKRPIL